MNATSAAAPSGLLIQLLADDDLATAFLRCAPPVTAVRCGLTCTTACTRMQQRQLARLCARDHRAGPAVQWPSSETHLRRLQQQRLTTHDSQIQSVNVHKSTDWTFERVHLWSHTPVFSVIEFGFASDALSSQAHKQIWSAASWLACHPGLRIKVCGFARQEAPSVLGKALAQARAARVRCQLLLCLRELRPECYSGEVAHEGVRDGGYSEGEDLQEVVAFYHQRVVGEHVQAEGLWPMLTSFWSTKTRHDTVTELLDAADDALQPEVPCSLSEICVTGFEPTSHLAF